MPLGRGSGCIFLLSLLLVEGTFIKTYNNVINASACHEIIQESLGFRTALVRISETPQWAPWDALLFNVISNYITQYRSNFLVPPVVHQDTGYTLVYRNKSDDSTIPVVVSPPSIILGITIFLNDDVGGGELVFPSQDTMITPECGRMVVWPNSFTHPHAFNAIRIGEQRFIMSWMRNTASL